MSIQEPSTKHIKLLNESDNDQLQPSFISVSRYMHYAIYTIYLYIDRKHVYLDCTNICFRSVEMSTQTELIQEDSTQPTGSILGAIFILMNAILGRVFNLY